MKNILFFVAVCITAYTYGQLDSGDPTEIDYTSELVKIAKGAEAPEAAFFTKYGNTPVSLYTGTPNVSIPLYEYQGREFNLPLQLVYDAQAIKVEEQASWVGLHWNLVVGGRVTRIVNGLPDDSLLPDSQTDYTTMFNDNLRNQMKRYRNVGHTYNSIADAEEYFRFMERTNTNKADISQDYFSVSAPGLDEMIVIDLEDLKARSLKNPRTKVEYQRNGTIDSWTITSENGMQYIFSAQEKTYKQGNDALSSGGIIQEYVSSWLLTKMISPTKKDIYEFGYTSSGYWNQPYASSQENHVTNILRSNPGGLTITGGTTSTFQPLTKLNQQFLNAIKHNGNKIVSFLLKKRDDIALSVPSALGGIHIHQPIPTTTPSVEILKKIVFDHTYFSTDSTNPSSLSHDDIRLKLDKITIYGSTNKPHQKYSFEYIHPTSVPSKKSLSQDYMGYHNGANNSVLYPEVVKDGDIYRGADRNVKFNYARVGLLQKIVYPTSGYTTFEYEPNSIPNNESIEYEEREVSYGTASVSGGINPSNSSVCGPSCVDTFGGPPNISETVFKIHEAGDYRIDYRTNGQYTATMFRHPQGDQSVRPSPIPYNQVIDPNTNEQLVPYLWNGGSSGSIRSVHLTPGYYQMTLANSFPQGSTYLRVYRRERVPIYNGDINFIKAGVRIKSITDYSANQIKTSQKKYRYTQSLENQFSSGKVIFQPQFTYYTSRTNTIEGLSRTITTMHRTTGTSSNQPHVVYSRVYEFETNIKNDKSLNGYTYYDFHTGASGVITSSSRPHVNSYLPDYKMGKEKKKVVHSNDKLINNVKNTYNDIPYYSATGLTTTSREDYAQKYIYISKDNTTGKYQYAYLEPIWIGGGHGGNIVFQAAPPAPCQDGPGKCIGQNFSPLFLKRTLMSGKIGNTVKVSKTEVLNNKELTTINTMTYDTAGNYLLKKQTTTASDGVDYTTKFYYPEDFSGSVYTSLQNANRLTEVLQAETYEGTSKIATRKTIVKDWGNGTILPETVQSSKGTAPLENRIIYHKYDSNNNPLEVSQSEGSHTIYIWGYQDRYPIVKITNSSYTGMPVDVLDLIAQIRTASHTENSVAEEVIIQGLFEQLRNHIYFEEAEVTGYTYDPQIGVTSITDPKGYTTKYEYDDLQRLKYVRDAEGNLVSRNKYHYKNQ